MFVLEPGLRAQTQQDQLCFLLKFFLPRKALIETRNLSREGTELAWELGL